MNLKDLKRAYPPLSKAGQERFLRTLNELPEDAPQRRRLSYALVMVVLASLLLAASAVALIHNYSVRQVIHPKFAQEVLLIGEEHESDLLRASINDAFMDGQRLTLALSMEAQPGVKDLYVFPRLTAVSGGEELDLDIESGFDLFDGEWLPRRKEAYGEPGQFIVDMFIMEEIVPEERGDITWTLTFHVLRPNWPLEEDGTTLDGSFSSARTDMKVYLQRFLQAYRDKKILLDNGDQTVVYGAVLPLPQGVTEEEHLYMPTWERLVRSGAFSEVERFSKTFDTGSIQLPVYEVTGPDTRTTGAFTIRLAGVHATRQQLTASFVVTLKDPDYLAGAFAMYVKAYAGEVPLTQLVPSSSLSENTAAGRESTITMVYDLSEPLELPGSLRLVPYRYQIRQAAPDEPLQESIQETPEAAITLRLK